MKRGIENLADIKFFVNEFYKKVQNNTLLSPIFMDRHGGNRQPHLERMYLFWNAALFGKKGYIGNPFSKHISLAINETHFSQWLTLFSQTIDEHFEGALATDAKWREGIMAVNFLRRLNDTARTGAKPIM
jgi:hemoglobin